MTVSKLTDQTKRNKLSNRKSGEEDKTAAETPQT
jgi:hypothetical protein